MHHTSKNKAINVSIMIKLVRFSIVGFLLVSLIALRILPITRDNNLRDKVVLVHIMHSNG